MKEMNSRRIQRINNSIITYFVGDDRTRQKSESTSPEIERQHVLQRKDYVVSKLSGQ